MKARVHALHHEQLAENKQELADENTSIPEASDNHKHAMIDISVKILSVVEGKSSIIRKIQY